MGEIDETEAIRAIHVALDGGVTFIDTAAGRSERIVGQALAGRRDRVMVATKFGLTFDKGGGPELVNIPLDGAIQSIRGKP